MFEDGGVVGLFFAVIGLIFAAVGALLGIGLIRKVLTHRKVLRDGLPAQASCLETYLTQRRVSDEDGSSRQITTRHVILGFRTEDGRDIRFEDHSHVPRIVGDTVPVRYLPAQPHRAAAVDVRVSGVGVGVGVGVMLVLGLAVSLVFVCGGLTFAALGFGVAGLHTPGDPTQPTGTVEYPFTTH